MFSLNLFARDAFATVPETISVERAWRNICPTETNWQNIPANNLSVKQCPRTMFSSEPPTPQ